LQIRTITPHHKYKQGKTVELRTPGPTE